MRKKKNNFSKTNRDYSASELPAAIYSLPICFSKSSSVFDLHDAFVRSCLVCKHRPPRVEHGGGHCLIHVPRLDQGLLLQYIQGEVTGLIFIVTRAFKANKTPLLGKFSWAETVPCYPPIPPRTTCLRHSSDPSSAWLQAPPAAFQRHFNSGAFCLPDYVYLLRFC